MRRIGSTVRFCNNCRTSALMDDLMDVETVAPDGKSRFQILCRGCFESWKYFVNAAAEAFADEFTVYVRSF